MASIDHGRKTDHGTVYDVRWRELDGTGRSQTEDTPKGAEEFKKWIEDDLRSRRAEAKRKGIPPARLARDRNGAMPDDPFTKPATPTYRKVTDDYLATVSNESTRWAYMQRLRDHVWPVVLDTDTGRTFGQTPIGDIRASDMKRLRAFWATYLHPTTQTHVWVTACAVFNFAVDDDVLGKSPVKGKRGLKAPRAPMKVRPTAWPNEWVAAMYRNIDPTAKVYPVIGSSCGLRQGELFGLSPDDIYVNPEGERVIRVTRQVKTLMPGNRMVFGPPKHRLAEDGAREVPVPDHVWEQLHGFADIFPPQAVTLPLVDEDGAVQGPLTVRLYFTDPRRQAWLRERFNRRIWNPALAASGIPVGTGDNGSHALRHFFASRRVAEGAGLTRVQEWLGEHSEAFMLKAYGRYDRNTRGAFAVSQADELSRELFEG